MPEFIVTVTRTERITFVLDADSREDAEYRYLADAREIGSKTVSLTVDSVEEAESASYTTRLVATLMLLLGGGWTTSRQREVHLLRHAEGLFVTATVATDADGMLLTLEPGLGNATDAPEQIRLTGSMDTDAASVQDQLDRFLNQSAEWDVED
jgi:hypothetical protein